MKLAAGLALTLLFVSSAVSQQKVRDSAEAVKIAEKALMRIYGKKQIKSERPFKAKLENGIWTVSGTLHCKDEDGNPTDVCVGGAAVARISEADGHVISAVHYK
jgi:hypothetical protein